MNTTVLKEKIHEYLQQHKKEIIDTLKELIRIPSVRGDSSEYAPFGEACSEILRYTEELYTRNGFETELDEKGGYLLSFYGNGEKSLGIFAHGDVVPAGGGWLWSEPFIPTEKDGFIVGRGSLDDKSGIIISLYCAKLIRELQIPFHARLIMFCGVNEESGMQDIKNYLSKHTSPDFSLVPDTAFPLYRGNKGRLKFSLKSENGFSEGIRISGGTGASVIGEADAVLPFSEELYEEIIGISEDTLTITRENNCIHLHAVGIPKHSALPEGSLSAVKIISEALCRSANLDTSDRKLFETLLTMASSQYGKIFGIENTDPEFGRLTCVLTKISTDEDGSIIADYNLRYGSTVSAEQLIRDISGISHAYGFRLMQDYDFSIPHALPESDAYIQALMQAFREYTGNETVNTYVNAGGTYRQYLKNAAEIGTSLGGPSRFMPSGRGHVHQPDECISIDGLLNAIELTALMLLQCDQTRG